MQIHIHAPQATAKRAIAGDCPSCKRRTRFIGFFTPWYGWDDTCLRCGREWMDGQWMPLAFARGVRQANIEEAKRKWRLLPPVSHNHYGV